MGRSKSDEVEDMTGRVEGDDSPVESGVYDSQVAGEAEQGK